MLRLRAVVVGSIAVAFVGLSIVGCTTAAGGGGGGGGGGDGDGDGGGQFDVALEVSAGGAAGEGGWIDVDPTQQSYQDGDVITLTADPDPGYRFDHWAGDVSGQQNPLEVTVDGDLDVEAVFVAEDGVVPPDGDGDGDDGEPIEPTGGILADHESASAFDDIPNEYFAQAKSDFRIFYGHTSHGSQLIAGMDMLDTGAGRLSIEEVDGDLGTDGDTGWVDTTRDYLGASGNGFNIVMWSWCGGVSGNDEEGIDAYLDAMNGLEAEYPGIVFVYMTGHLDGSGPDGNLYVRNDQIRDYCRANDKVLYDFADVESYDPDGEYYPDGTDWCDWCDEWCMDHTCPVGDCVDDDHCQHANCFNCYRKGQAFWWMMARIAGWDGE